MLTQFFIFIDKDRGNDFISYLVKTIVENNNIDIKKKKEIAKRISATLINNLTSQTETKHRLFYNHFITTVKNIDKFTKNLIFCDISVGNFAKLECLQKQSEPLPEIPKQNYTPPNNVHRRTMTQSSKFSESPNYNTNAYLMNGNLYESVGPNKFVGPNKSKDLYESVGPNKSQSESWV